MEEGESFTDHCAKLAAVRWISHTSTRLPLHPSVSNREQRNPPFPERTQWRITIWPVVSFALFSACRAWASKHPRDPSGALDTGVQSLCLSATLVSGLSVCRNGRKTNTNKKETILVRRREKTVESDVIFNEYSGQIQRHDSRGIVCAGIRQVQHLGIHTADKI